MRHTPGGGTIQIRAAPSNGQVRFEVVDTGQGIPEEYQQAIFEQILRVPGSAGAAPGWGFHLPKKSSRLTAARWALESRARPGCTFWFTLPLAKEE